jgi:hypothetical protein
MKPVTPRAEPIITRLNWRGVRRLMARLGFEEHHSSPHGVYFTRGVRRVAARRLADGRIWLAPYGAEKWATRHLLAEHNEEVV